MSTEHPQAVAGAAPQAPPRNLPGGARPTGAAQHIARGEPGQKARPVDKTGRVQEARPAQQDRQIGKKKPGAKDRGNRRALPDHRPEDFFVLRTPLLPFEAFERWFGTDEQSAALMKKGGREAGAARLLELAGHAEVAEALFVASPALVESLERGIPTAAKKVDRQRQSLTRYLLRMMSRSTPFGLFAGGTLGRLAATTELRLGPRSSYRRHTRLDMDYLYRLTRDLERDPDLWPFLRYSPNSSLYRAAGRLRYAEGRLEGQTRAYHLVAVEENAFLAAALERAGPGASPGEIAAAVMACDPEGEIELDEAEAFVHELIDAQLLVSDLGPRVTGPEPIHDLVRRLGAIDKAAPVAACLEKVRLAIETLDDPTPVAVPVSPAAAYRDIGRQLGALGTDVQLPRLFQVDMSKPSETVTLGSAVVEEVERSLAFLHRLKGMENQDAFSTFKEDFERRYEAGRLVPLVEVLDEEVGIGFQRATSIGTEHSPLLEGIPFPARPAPWQVPWTGVLDLVAKKLMQTAAAGDEQLRWSPRDLDPLRGSEPAAPLPDAFQTLFTLTAPSPEALASGDFTVHFKSASGPSGAGLLGRFCHGDGDLRECVEQHVHREEAHDEEAIFAEVVHLPEGRIGNILLRPVLRGWEIPFLGHGGAPEDRQISISDLHVTVVGREVILWSKRLERRIIPRLTSAHNFSLRGLGIYRFLCALQFQGTSGGLSWSWGPFDQLPSLPRVVLGRTVLSPAQWRVDREEIREWCNAEGSERARRLEVWRQRRKVPQRVLLADGDHELLVDFGRELTVDAFVALVKNRPSIRLVEHVQGEDRLVASGPEGRFAHEIVLPFVRRASRPRPRPPFQPAAPYRPTRAVRRHGPGSPWIYAKLYSGSATADRLLAGPVREVVERFGDMLRPWFFIRYADPDFHLRLRFRVQEPAQRTEVQRTLLESAGRLMEQGLIWDFQLSTYRPEQERYGGEEGLRRCERIFQADSEAVLGMLPFLAGDDGARRRWLVALASVDGLIRRLFAADPEAEIHCLESMKQGFAAEFGVDSPMRKRVGKKLREEQDLIAAVLAGQVDRSTPLGDALHCLAERDRYLLDEVAQLRRLSELGHLSVPLPRLASSLAHMAVNRLIPAEARAHEVVLYDFLHRQAMSRRARQRKAAV